MPGSSAVPSGTRDLRRDAATIYGAALAGVEPGTAVLTALSGLVPGGPVRLLSIGKAAVPMAAGAVRHLDRGSFPFTGLVVAPDDGGSDDPRLRLVRGDHPLPGDRSENAARAVADWIERVAAGDEAWLLLSGGASSLVGAPVPEVTTADYRAMLASLFRAGLPIDRWNTIRKRFARFGAGRLAACLAPALIRVFALSDVPSDDPVDIGSGPCEPDPATAGDVLRLLDSAMGRDRIPASAARYLERIIAGALPETPKPGDPLFARRTTRMIASNRTALDHAAAAARALGYDVIVAPARLQGEAAEAGRSIADRVVGQPAGGRTAWLFGGETTVALGADGGTGGRCQELALAAALRLARSPDSDRLVILAAGTDGRDGPTDAAGAIVDSRTGERARSAGVDPEGALGRHDAYRALDAAGALLRTGPTGTNVMDLVIALRVGRGGVG